MKKQITTSIVLVALAVAVPVAAQVAPPSPEQQTQPPTMIAVPDQVPAPAVATQKPLNLAEIRHHIYVMEGALARAVDYGAKQLNREILAVMPGVFMLEGESRARGVHLEGYGVFFDVRVPMMRQSMMWSMQVLMNQGDAASRAAASDLRRYMEGITDRKTLASLENAVRQLESQTPQAAPRSAQNVPGMVMPEMRNPSSPAVEPFSVAGSRPTPTPPADSLWAKDPNRAYTEAVTRALVDAMIDYSTPMQIPADQWLTVAARDDEGRDSLAPQDPLEEIVTMIYRVKGSDLQLYRTGKIDRDEVRKRVQITQF
jgi:hypothetical protein